MLGFSNSEVDRAHIYDGERDLTATSGPIWLRFMNGTAPENGIAQRCSGSENSLSQCNVSVLKHYFICNSLILFAFYS